LAAAEVSMKHAALGFRAHSGWTALVALALDEDSPRALLRQRPHLVKTFTFEFRQPYHTARRRPSAEAAPFIARMQAEARDLAYKSIHSVQGDLEKQGYELAHCGLLLASGKPLPDLAHILASHPLIHTADGELFREALLYASRQCGFAVLTAKESELLAAGSHALHQQPDQLARRLTHLGDSLGSPWAQDEKFAALVAWLALLQRESAAGTADPKKVLQYQEPGVAIRSTRHI
jgi:hypothetical protein